MISFERQDFGVPLCESYVSDLLLHVREYVQHDLPFYSNSLRKAFLTIDPVFIKDSYARFFFHCASTVPGWIQRVILANGKGESEGSESLLTLWQSITYNDFVAGEVMAHAKDESRHSRMFINLTQLAFPHFMTAEGLHQYASTLPDVRTMKHIKGITAIPENHLIDHLVQMNIGEIRTRLHMHLFAPIIWFLTPEESKPSVQNQLQVLAADEMRHIGYTARLMETWAEDGNAELIEKLYLGRLNTFNKITVDHTRDAIERYGQGRFPELLDI
jgi:hypothetical protein